jgi:hypothetical protein
MDYNEFMTVINFHRRNRCGYESQGELLIPPAAVSTYMVPNVALLGLCYTDDIKLIFINNTFNGLSKDKKDTTVPIEVMIRFKLTSAKEKFNDVIYSSWN